MARVSLTSSMSVSFVISADVVPSEALKRFAVVVGR
jgi:hypothetical protein